jgi:hypothetical protein
MSKQVDNLNDMFNNIESKITGGTNNDTQPYNTFRSSLNNIYNYFSVIFVTNNKNKEKYKFAVDNLEKPCDCSKYKCKEVETEENHDTDNTYQVYNSEFEENEENEENKENKKSELLLKNSKIL